MLECARKASESAQAAGDEDDGAGGDGGDGDGDGDDGDGGDDACCSGPSSTISLHIRDVAEVTEAINTEIRYRLENNLFETPNARRSAQEALDQPFFVSQRVRTRPGNPDPVAEGEVHGMAALIYDNLLGLPSYTAKAKNIAGKRWHNQPPNRPHRNAWDGNFK